MTYAAQQLAAERVRTCLDLARQVRQVRRQRVLRRASRIERVAERRLIRAWCRAAELRDQLEAPVAEPPVTENPAARASRVFRE